MKTVVATTQRKRGSEGALARWACPLNDASATTYIYHAEVCDLLEDMQTLKSLNDSR